MLFIGCNILNLDCVFIEVTIIKYEGVSYPCGIVVSVNLCASCGQ